MKTQVSPEERKARQILANRPSTEVDRPVGQTVPSPRASSPQPASMPSSYDNQRSMSPQAAAANDGIEVHHSPDKRSNQIETGGRQRGHQHVYVSTPTSNPLKSLPPLFLYIETGDFVRAAERAKRHPREVKAWVNIQTKSSSKSSFGSFGGNNSPSNSKAKRLALHQACFKVCLFL